MNKLIKLNLLIFIFNFNFILAQDINSVIKIELKTNIDKVSGKHYIDTLNWARIENPLLIEKSSIGIFTSPPNNSLPFDIAFVLGNLTGGEIDADIYNVVKIENDKPLFNPNTKSGFMTIVINDTQIPKDEFFSTEGFFKVLSVVDNLVTGEFEIKLESTKLDSIIEAKGSFVINSR